MSKQDDESNESNSKRAERMEFLVRLWTQHYIPAASEARKRFMRDFNEVEEYFQGDHTALYTKIAEFMNPEGLLCLTVNLAQEVRGYIGPHLYARNPARTVNPKSNNEPMRCLAKIQEAYLNATPEDTKLKDEYRKVVDEALIAGRGASWTVKDPWTKLVTTRHVPIRDVYLDPDARCLADCQWIAIRRQEPLHVLKKRREPAKPGDKDRLGIKWDTDGLKPDVLTPSDDSVERWTEGGRTLHEEVAKKKGKTSHVVRYWVIYSKMGTGLSLGKLPNGEERFRGEDSGNRFTKLVLVPGFDRPLFKGDWDLSLYLDDDWPIGFMDFTPTLIGSRNEETESDNGGLWPVSLVKLAIGHQKAIDLLVTRWINDLFQRARMIGVVPAQATDSVMRAFQSGDPWTAIELASDAAGVPIRDLFHLLQLGQVDPTFREQLQVPRIEVRPGHRHAADAHGQRRRPGRPDPKRDRGRPPRQEQPEPDRGHELDRGVGGFSERAPRGDRRAREPRYRGGGAGRQGQDPTQQVEARGDRRGRGAEPQGARQALGAGGNLLLLTSGGAADRGADPAERAGLPGGLARVRGRGLRRARGERHSGDGARGVERH